VTPGVLLKVTAELASKGTRLSVIHCHSATSPAGLAPVGIGGRFNLVPFELASAEPRSQPDPFSQAIGKEVRPLFCGADAEAEGG
jgi:hypothetical protein